MPGAILRPDLVRFAKQHSTEGAIGKSSRRAVRVVALTLLSIMATLSPGSVALAASCAVDGVAYPVTIANRGTITGTAGNDVALRSPGRDVADTLPGDDVVCPTAGDDDVTLGEGDDRLVGGSGDDAIVGGVGPLDQGTGDDGTDTAVSCKTVVGFP